MNITTGSIVVGYDGSADAGAALDWAAGEAERRQVSLTVLHVLDYLTLTPGLTMPAVDLYPADAIALEGARRAQKTAGTIEVTAQTRIDKVSHSLVQSSHRSGLLVLGTRGHGDVVGAFLGSVAIAVSATAFCPVVIVRGDSTSGPGPDRPVVVGADGSPGSDVVVRYAAAAAARSSARLVVVTAFSSTTARAWADAAVFTLEGEGGPTFGGIAETAAGKVGAAAADIARQAQPGLDVTTTVVEGPVATMLGTISLGCGLLVVGSRGRGGLAGLVLGSVSHAAIHSSPCPVAVVRGDAASHSPQAPAGGALARPEGT